jgi:uncharacterized protein
MQAPVVQGVKNLLDSRATDLDFLTLSWFGGEPLLALDVIKDIHVHLHALILDHPKIRFGSIMNTNAYLLSREVFEELYALGITGYQVAFDGPRDWHDRKRVLPDGRGTFDRVWENVSALREFPGLFSVIIRVHVDQDNMDALPTFINQCSDAFKGDDRFKIFIRPLSRLGGREDEKLRVLEGGMNHEKIDELRGMAACQGLAKYGEKAGSAVCYASTANCFLVRADGRINKCTVALNHPGNQVGRLNEDGTLELDKHLMLKWMRGLRSEDERELHCPLIDFPTDA